VKLDAVNPGKWFGDQFAKMLGTEKVLVQKSGYFSRAVRADANGTSLTVANIGNFAPILTGFPVL